MALLTNQVTCPSNAATLIVPAVLSANAGGSNSGGTARRSVAISNLSAQGIYLGPAGVTTANGYLLPSNTTITLLLALGDAVYGRGAQFSPVASYLETGV